MRGRSDARRLIAASLAAVAAVLAPLLVSSSAGALTPSLGDLAVGAAFAMTAVVMAGRAARAAACLGIGAGVWIAVLVAPLSPIDGVVERAALLPHALLVVVVVVASDPRARDARTRVLSASAIAVAVLAGVGVLRPAFLVLGIIAVVAGLRRRRNSVTALQLLSGLALIVFQVVVTVGAGSPTARANVLDLMLIVIAAGAASAEIRGRDLWRTIRRASSTAGDPFGDRLGATLGGGAMVVALAMPDGGFSDSTGAPVDAPNPGVRIHDEAGQLLAVIGSTAVVDPLVAAPLRSLLERVAELAALRRSLRVHATELEVSRRLLLSAADAERDELQRRVVEDVSSRIYGIAERLGPVSESLAARARATADELAGREQAVPADRSLSALLSRFASDQVSVNGAALAGVERLSPEVARGAWFTCAEAIVNATKHAPGSRVSIAAEASAGRLLIVIEDDGPGGADMHGPGLRGLADRAEDLGGWLRVDSARSGTRLTWNVPLDLSSTELRVPASESRGIPDSRRSAPLVRSAP